MLRHAWSRDYNYCPCGPLGDSARALSLCAEPYRTIAGGERTLKSGPTALCGGYKTAKLRALGHEIHARFRDGWERSMAKIRISSTELVWIFHQRLEAFYDCPPEVPIAIVPDNGSWMAVMSAKVRTRYPHWARRVEGIQKRLREIYVLKD